MTFQEAVEAQGNLITYQYSASDTPEGHALKMSLILLQAAARIEREYLPKQADKPIQP